MFRPNTIDTLEVGSSDVVYLSAKKVQRGVVLETRKLCPLRSPQAIRGCALQFYLEESTSEQSCPTLPSKRLIFLRGKQKRRKGKGRWCSRNMVQHAAAAETALQKITMKLLSRLQREECDELRSMMNGQSHDLYALAKAIAGERFHEAASKNDALAWVLIIDAIRLLCGCAMTQLTSLHAHVQRSGIYFARNLHRPFVITLHELPAHITWSGLQHPRRLYRRCRESVLSRNLNVAWYDRRISTAVGRVMHVMQTIGLLSRIISSSDDDDLETHLHHIRQSTKEMLGILRGSLGLLTHRFERTPSAYLSDLNESAEGNMQEGVTPHTPMNAIEELVFLCNATRDELSVAWTECLPQTEMPKWRHWPAAAGWSFLAMFLFTIFMRRPKRLLSQITGFATAFVRTYCVEPLAGIIETLRHPRHIKSNEAVVSAGTLQALIATYYRECVPGTSNEAAETLGKNEDLSGIVSQYELLMKRPFRSLWAGTLQRIFLIQVQKQIVEMERLMAATNQLMEQHRLNFHMMALMPFVTTSFLVVLVWWITRRTKIQPLVLSIRRIMRNVERIVNRATLETDASLASLSTLSYYDQGQLILEIHTLRRFISHLPTEDAEMFGEDLEDLESFEYSREQRLQVLDRMYRTHEILHIGAV